MLAAQGFDAQHFETVHNRRLLAPFPRGYPAPFARRNCYEAEIVGTGIAIEFCAPQWAPTVAVAS